MDWEEFGTILLQVGIAVLFGLLMLVLISATITVIADRIKGRK